MKKKIQEYLRKPYSRVLIPDDGSFMAEILEFSGCVAQGDSPNEAFENLENTAASWIETALEQGIEIPEPFINLGYGGKVALRLPRSMHKQATRLAQRDGVSLNQFLVSAIAARIGTEDLYSRLLEKIEKTMPAHQIVINRIIQTVNVPTNNPVLRVPSFGQVSSGTPVQ